MNLTTQGGAAGEVVDVPSPGLINLTHLIYVLHALSVVIGIAGSATVVGSFVFGLPSIVAVILNYVKRSDVRGTYLDSHFSWQIRTFWWAVLWGLVALVVTLVLIATIVGILLYWLPIAVVGVWIGYRVIRGWLALRDARPIDA
jgi:uncharacterized membrane protein